jgi:F-type H+-transporting ATPase subunit epsilon
MSFDLEIVTPKEVIAKVAADEIIIPAAWGQMDILPQHTDYITTLTEGELTYRRGAEKKTHRITGGLMTVHGNHATVLVDGLLADVVDIKSHPEAQRRGHTKEVP